MDKNKLINWLLMQPGAMGRVRLVVDGRVPFDPNESRPMYRIARYLRTSGELTSWQIKWDHSVVSVPTLEEWRADFNKRLDAALATRNG